MVGCSFDRDAGAALNDVNEPYANADLATTRWTSYSRREYFGHSAGLRLASAAFRSPTLILKKKRRCGGRPAACNPGSWAVSASTQAARNLGWPLHLQSPFGFGHRDQGRIELHERFVDGAVLGMARLAA